MTKLEVSINLNILEVATSEYLNQEDETKAFLKNWVGGYWVDKTAQERENYTRVTERQNGKWETLITLCKLLNIESSELIAYVKSMNRYTKHNGKYDRYIDFSRMNYRQEKTFLTLISRNEDNQYYQSTGRLIRA